MLDYIKIARETHGDFYDYSKAILTDSTTNVTIICPKHGEFQQKIHAHIRGARCRECSREAAAKKLKLPLSEFLERAKTIHDDKYDYSKVEYDNNRDRISIICPKHGEFQQTVAGHLTGYGCRNCALDKMFVTQEEFVRRSSERHDNFYDYSKVVYTDSRNKVTIICPKHGEFQQIAASHLGGSKCGLCSNEDRCLTAREFVEKARNVHGNLYDYSKVDYESAITKVTIRCKEHGEFLQIPNSHLCGAGCPVCSSERSFLTNDQFVERSKALHGDRYSYDKTKYIRSDQKVTITCPKHGDFYQAPNTHLSGAGCRNCGRDGIKITKKEFIQKARKIHDDRYSYDKLEYNNIRTKIRVTCKKHGDFFQLPTIHLRGSGCPKCNASKGELTIELILLKNKIKYHSEYVIPETKTKYRYDFYLPEYRALIEYHGVQHFQPVGFFGGEDTYVYIKHNDQIKRSLANEFGYVLIEFDHTQLENMTEKQFQKLVLKRLAIVGKH